LSVLAAHPDPEVRRCARVLLEPLGYRVFELDGPTGAVEACRAGRPDVVLVPDGEGLAVLDAIKRDVDLFGIAVIAVVAGELKLEPALALLRRGAHDVLRMPIEPAELVARVQSAARTKTLQEELTHQSRRLESLIYGDELTGIFNRRFLLTQLGALVSGARRHERPLSVVMLDIDHFKSVNDEHGHAAGDAVLSAVAGVMRDRLRAEDWVGRLGGEEFLALLPDDDAAGAATVAETLRAAIERLVVPYEDLDMRVTASVGWATLEPGEGPDELLRRVDDALYAAKHSGRNATRGAATLRRRI
jgi:diguanylate cyclase (GGDEF)-like protein